MAGERAATSISVDTDPNDTDQNIDALIQGARWDTSSSNVVTFSFPDSAADIDYSLSFGWTFAAGFTTTQQAQTRLVLSNVAAIADIVFEELGDDPGEDNAVGTLRFFEVSGLSTAYGYFPGGTERAGDTYYNTALYNNPSVGSYAYITLMHETGHALGLEHAHEGGPGGEIASAFDSMEFTVMTYNSFVGQEESPAFYTNASNGYAQSLMMFDIAALQRLYGANWDTNSDDSVYTFDPVSGQMSINGVAAATPGSNVIFRTIWDGNGNDTYDLSNFSNALDVDLAPGGWLDLDVGGNDLRAQLNRGFDGNGSYVGASAQEWARAHVFNALQHEGDARSLIENANGGSAGDVLSGNAANNEILGNGGDDVLYGLLGDDHLWGGSGQDQLDGGDGKDLLYGDDGEDTLAGGGGNDVLRGNKGKDLLQGGDGNDRLLGGNMNDTLYGGAGGDKLMGHGGRDILVGGDGFDRLIGGTEQDTLSGGKSGDHFIFSNGDGADVITDFGLGQDMIHLLDQYGFADVTITNSVNGHVVSWAGGEVLLEGYYGSLDQSDFIFG